MTCNLKTGDHNLGPWLRKVGKRGSPPFGHSSGSNKGGSLFDPWPSHDPDDLWTLFVLKIALRLDKKNRQIITITKMEIGEEMRVLGKLLIRALGFVRQTKLEHPWSTVDNGPSYPPLCHLGEEQRNKQIMSCTTGRPASWQLKVMAQILCEKFFTLIKIYQKYDSE